MEEGKAAQRQRQYHQQQHQPQYQQGVSLRYLKFYFPKCNLMLGPLSGHTKI